MRSTTSNSLMLNRSCVLFVVRQRVLERDVVAPTVEHGPRQQFGVAKRVGDAVRPDRILEVRGVTDERPTTAERTSHEPVVAQPRTRAVGADAARSRSATSGAPSATICSINCVPPLSDPGSRAGSEHAGSPVVGRDHSGTGVGAEHPFEAVRDESGPVAVGGGTFTCADPGDGGTDPSGNARSDAVGSDHETGGELDLDAVRRQRPHTGDGAIAPRQIEHRRVVVHLGARVAAARTSSGSSRVRRGAYNASTPWDCLMSRTARPSW